jgi:NAD(P)-dependent dehydrogenase (short-subunit alcohol dehydrogenase family)
MNIVITGASAGIGEAAARDLAKDNDLIIVGRSEATKTIADEIGARYFRTDFTDLTSVRKLAKDIKMVMPHIDLLIKNAGGVMKKIAKTNDGFEQTIQVNYLAQFLLTHLLMDTLISSKAGIINTSSAANLSASLKADDLESARSTWSAYSNSKLLDLIHAKELSRRYRNKGIIAVSFHPGVVATSFGRTLKGPFAFIYNSAVSKLLKTPNQGADTMIWLARHKAQWTEGAYYSDRKIGRAHPSAKDAKLANNIWMHSEQMLGIDAAS